MLFIQMSGFPGSGKSTLARLIAERTGAVIIDHDIIKSALMQSIDTDITPKAAGKISYHIDWALVDFQLSQGFDVILDSPCFYTEMIERGMKLARKYDAQYKYVECYLNDLQEIDRRLKNRARMISQIHSVIATEEQFQSWVNNSKRPEGIDYLVVDSSKPIRHYFNRVIQYIES
ncbi:AAA domain-containing protein [Bacillus oleivorans]|uniref:AAA domain-containing protein n=1 Tax=Bacillus oleivorans TaxID=1448271 RepID=A0A285CT96_9BACI|nr:ATP-binding protein [Bacillus oleivorans]SNX70645.1 AAA domain-containing protein [Bacillus oleivorans]